MWTSAVATRGLPAGWHLAVEVSARALTRTQRLRTGGGVHHVPRRAELVREHVAHDAGAVDHVGDSFDAIDHRPADAECVADLLLVIGDQRKRKLQRIREATLSLNVVGRDADDLSAQRLKVFPCVAELRRLARSAGCERAGKEEQHNCSSAMVREVELPTLRRLRAEIWGLLASADHASQYASLASEPLRRRASRVLQEGKHRHDDPLICE